MQSLEKRPPNLNSTVCKIFCTFFFGLLYVNIYTMAQLHQHVLHTEIYAIHTWLKSHQFIPSLDYRVYFATPNGYLIRLEFLNTDVYDHFMARWGYLTQTV